MGVFCLNIGPHEDLVLDDDREFVASCLDEVGQTLVDEACFKPVTDKHAGGNPGIGVKPGNADSVIVVPHETSALVQGIIIFGRAGEGFGVEYLVVEKAEPMGAQRSEPIKGAAVADPRDEPSMEVDSRGVEHITRFLYGCIDGENVLGHVKQVTEGDLDRHVLVLGIVGVTTLADDDPTKVLLRLITAAKRKHRVDVVLHLLSSHPTGFVF